MTDSLNICHVINSIEYGGAETMLVDLIDVMSDTEVTVISIEGMGRLQPKLKSAGATVKGLDESIRFDPRTVAKLRRIFIKESYDVVHAHLPYAQTVSRLAACMANQHAIVSTQHNAPTAYHPLTRITEQMTRPLDTKTVAVSQGVERAHTGTAHEPGRLEDDWCTIYNGIAVEKFCTDIARANDEQVRDEFNINASTTVLLNVGRYVPAKGQKKLINAFSRAETDDVILLLVGHGPLQDDLRSLAADNGLSDCIHVTGQVSSVHPYYAISDVFVTASRIEGLPITLLEAMAAGLPIITSDIPGIDEVVQNGETGLLFSPNDIEELASIIASFEHRSLSKYTRTARDCVKSEFDIEHTAESYRQLYYDIISNNTENSETL
jgi:glycosyltransferase involved in cell wall biosynthesis